MGHPLALQHLRQRTHRPRLLREVACEFRRHHLRQPLIGGNDAGEAPGRLNLMAQTSQEGWQLRTLPHIRIEQHHQERERWDARCCTARCKVVAPDHAARLGRNGELHHSVAGLVIPTH